MKLTFRILIQRKQEDFNGESLVMIRKSMIQSWKKNSRRLFQKLVVVKLIFQTLIMRVILILMMMKFLTYNNPIHTDWNQVTKSKQIFKDSQKKFSQSISQLDLPVSKSVTSKHSAIVSSGSSPHGVIKISSSTNTTNQNM